MEREQFRNEAFGASCVHVRLFFESCEFEPVAVPNLHGCDREQLDGTSGQLADETRGSDRKTSCLICLLV